MDDLTKLWLEYIELLHNIYRNLNLETDSSYVEKMIAIVQVGSDKLKNINDTYISILHTLETATEFIKTTLTEMDERIRQNKIDVEREMEKINNMNKTM
jgi:translation initiation factor 2B subunit (eIF-2B alpha/beta/delta family)